MNIQQNAHLVGQQYSWLGTILYMGVLVGEYPTNLLLQKLPVAKYLSANVFPWGAVVACSAAAKNFGSLMAVRFPPRHLRSLCPACLHNHDRHVVHQEGAGGPHILVVLHDRHSAHAWGASSRGALPTSPTETSIRGSFLFLVLGCVTCAWAIFIGWWLPDSPMKARCFNEDQKRLMIERVRVNETGIQNKVWKLYQMVEALTDPIIWCYVLLNITSTLIIGGLGVFSNLIIASFGFSYLQTQLLNIAQGAVTIFVMIGSAALATKSDQTIWVMHAWTM
ncbi:hypothetical protein OPQ81_010408 [Rhizoctonia solani]|nr:hypothetical protein OPQ81_010408 [Rhizoctonia solani]